MNQDQEPPIRDFDSVKDDPQSLLLFIDKYVKVELIKNRCFSGYLHSIDPISLSVILSTPHEGNYRTTLIPGHAILDIQEETSAVDITPPPRKQITEATESDTVQRKAKIIAWFKNNLLPVTENGDNLAIGNVSVLPPYSVSDICAENPVVAFQIRKLIESMPDDFEVQPTSMV